MSDYNPMPSKSWIMTIEEQCLKIKDLEAKLKICVEAFKYIQSLEQCDGSFTIYRYDEPMVKKVLKEIGGV